MSGLAWLGIGCGGLLVIALGLAVYGFFLAKKTIDDFAANPEKAAAEMIVSMQPDLRVLSKDEANGTMTLRTKDGEEMTLSYKDIQDGKFIVTDKDGNTTLIGSADLSQVPAWVPQAPEFTEGFSVFHSEAGGKASGQFSGKSPRGAEALRTFYEGEASTLGMTSNSSRSMEAGGTSTITLGFSDGGRSMTIVITGKPGSSTLVNTNYSEAK